MRQGVLPYEVEVVEKGGTVTARSGLPLVWETMRALGVEEAIRGSVQVRERARGANEVGMIEWLVLLLASGGTCMDDMRVLAADEGLCRLVGQRPPSPDAVRRFLYAFHDGQKIEHAQEEAQAAGQIAFIPKENEALQGLGWVQSELVAAVARQGQGTVATLDHDATVVDSHKREALAHYKGGRGYQPAVIYWVEQDLVIGDEFRDGNVPAAMANLALIRRGFANLPLTITTYRFRADSACYEQAVLKWLVNPEREGGPQGEIEFTISADMSTELRGKCVSINESRWVIVEERAEETVCCAEVEFTPGDWPKAAKPLRYVAMRIRKKQGWLFASGYDTKYLAVVSNRLTLSAPDLLRWHWGKAGTIEHLHDVTKNELGGGVLPCGRFGANAAWYRLSLLTYNVLSAMKSIALPATFRKARPKRLRFAVFTIAGRLTSHAGKLRLHISAAAEQIASLVSARRRLRHLIPVPG